MASTVEDFRTLFEHGPDGLVLADPATGEIIDCNELACTLTGYGRSELRGLSGEDLTAPDWTPDREPAALLRTARTDGRASSEWRIQTKDGSVVPIEVSLTLVDLEGGEHLLARVSEIAERKSRERERDRKLRAMEKAPFGITLSDPAEEANPIVYANEGFEELTGYATADVLGRNCRFLQGPETDPETVAEIRQAIEAEEPITRVVRNYRKDGSAYWNRLTIAPVHDRNGEVVNFVGFQEDVTEREQAAEAVRKVEAMEEAMDGMAVLDSDGRFVYVNESYAEIHEANDQSELLDTTWHTVYGAEEAERLVTEALPTLEATGTWRGQAVGRRLDGTAFQQELSLSRLEDGRTICVVRDITERKAGERKLARFEKAVEQTGHATMLVDTDGTIEYVNQAFERITGYDAADVLGETPNVLNSGEHDKSFFSDLWSTILAGDVWESRITNQRDDGSLIHLNHTIAPITNEAGEVEEFVAVFSDVTDRELEGQQLTVLSRVLRHNLRNTLNVMIGYAESIQDTVEDDSLTSQAATIRETGSELLQVSEQARSIQQIVNEVTQRDARTNLSDRLESLIEEFESRDTDVRLTLSTTAQGDIVAHPSVPVAVSEVIENAIEHNDAPNPRVSVDVAVETDQQRGRWAEVEVRDNGPGIPEHEQQTLREGEEKPLMHGSGLGLWLIHWIVRQVGGKVAIDDNEPRGTVLTIDVPCELEGS